MRKHPALLAAQMHPLASPAGSGSRASGPAGP
jgi:hypothetical protein